MRNKLHKDQDYGFDDFIVKYNYIQIHAHCLACKCEDLRSFWKIMSLGNQHARYINSGSFVDDDGSYRRLLCMCS